MIDLRWILIAATSVGLFGQDADHFRALVRDHAEMAAVKESAAQWEANEHDPVRHLLAVEEIAQTLLDSDPALSLDYCRKVRSAPQLWPLMLDAEVRLRDWALAERYGEAVMEEIDAGRLCSRVSDWAEEGRLRRLYADALLHQGKAEDAARQIAIVDPDAANTPAIRAEGAAIAARERARRVANLRSEVLAGEIHEPSTPFHLRDLNGREVTLTNYLGEPFVAVFWATWCAPCVQELSRLNGFSEKNPNRLVAVSIDDEPQTAARFAWKHGFHFTILAADRATARRYTQASTFLGANVPQLYVFDAKGQIRFHLIGFDDDGMLGQKLEWMLAAALK